MVILMQSKDLKNKEIYKLTKSENVVGLSTLPENTVFNIEKYALIEKEDRNNNKQEYLYIETDKGSLYATNSRSFIDEFLDVVSLEEDVSKLPEIRLLKGKSSNNRTYITCRAVL